MLKISKLALDCKGGSHLVETHLSEFTTIILKCLTLEMKVQSIAAEICAQMLTLKNLKLPQELASKIIEKVNCILINFHLLFFEMNASKVALNL